MLQNYESVSGQAINFQKSGIYFSNNVDRDKKLLIEDLLLVRNDHSTGKYLGLPSLVGSSKKVVFNFVKEQVWKRIQGWSEKIISRAGKAVLIRNVAQAILTYCISCFLLLKSLCQEIEKMMNIYWWSTNSNSKKGVHWLAWDNICMSKGE